jgi:hypothetical protein
MPYQFEFNGQVLEFEAQDYNNDVFKAMGEANNKFDLPEGAWMENGPGKFRWVEGNFFD